MKTTSALLALVATALASTTIQHHPSTPHKSVLADTPPQIFNTAGTAVYGTAATTLILAGSTTGIYANTTTATTTKSKTKSAEVATATSDSSSTDDESSSGSPLVTGVSGSGSGSQPSTVPHSGASSEMFGGMLSGFKGWALSAVIVALAV